MGTKGQICLLTFEYSKSSGPISTPVLLLSNQESTPSEEKIFLMKKRKANHTGTATHFGQIKPPSLGITTTSWKSQKLHATYKPVLSFCSEFYWMRENLHKNTKKNPQTPDQFLFQTTNFNCNPSENTILSGVILSVQNLYSETEPSVRALSQRTGFVFISLDPMAELCFSQLYSSLLYGINHLFLKYCTPGACLPTRFAQQPKSFSSCFQKNPTTH